MKFFELNRGKIVCVSVLSVMNLKIHYKSCNEFLNCHKFCNEFLNYCKVCNKIEIRCQKTLNSPPLPFPISKILIFLSHATSSPTFLFGGYLRYVTTIDYLGAMRCGVRLLLSHGHCLNLAVRLVSHKARLP